MRFAEVKRVTTETSVNVVVNLDGSGIATLDFIPKFMKHLLTALVLQSGFDVEITANGDFNHHIIEDIAICFGKAIKDGVDDLSSLSRYGYCITPMDRSLSLIAVDISNRPCSVVDLKSEAVMIEDTKIEDIVHFIQSLAVALSASIHVKVLYGENEHHKVESAFKGLGMALKQATSIRGEEEPQASSKGVL